MKTVLLKSFIVSCLIGSSFMMASQASACVEGNIISRELKRDYSGITALPIARYLGLDDSCNGRRLNKIILEASSSAGPGLATLIVNGIPVGVTKEIGADLKTYEFPLDPDYNYLGQNILNMEIRLSGDFYIEHVEARLADVSQNQDDDPWSVYPVKIGKTDEIGDELTSTIFQVKPEDSHLSQIVFIARKNDFFVHRVIVQFTDGHKKAYGSADIEENTARRIDIDECDQVESIKVIGRAANEEECAQLELRGKKYD